MIKAMKNFSLLAIASMAVSFSFAGSKEGVYFCTRDLDVLPSDSTSATGGNPNNKGGIEAYHPLRNNKHSDQRHCFILHGTLQEEHNTKILHPEDNFKIYHRKDDKLRLTNIKTLGYGLADYPNPFGPNIGGAYQEDDLQNKVVSCVPIVEESESTNSKDVHSNWLKAQEVMHDETAKPYHLGKNSCCSVVYKAAKTIYKGSESDLLKIIDPDSFNLYGLGITWGDGPGGEMVNKIGLSSSSLSGYSVKIVNFSAQLFKKEEKKPDL